MAPRHGQGYAQPVHGAQACSVSVVVPTRNEAPNIAVLFQRVSKSLSGLDGSWELIFVDDSDDTTPDTVRGLPATATAQVKLVHREPTARRGGLGGAVQEGFREARGQVIAVMDGDLQHPPEVLPALIAPVLARNADLVAGNRYGPCGGSDGLDGPWRRAVSKCGRWLAHRAVPASRALEDPMSGLFAFRRSVVEEVPLHADGYKILLEVTARGNWWTASNVPYVFAKRQAGDSKATVRQGLVFLRHLAKLTVYRREAEPRLQGRASRPGRLAPHAAVRSWATKMY
jgi:glycosyltransferase involved in cell wall biosynthesis